MTPPVGGLTLDTGALTDDPTARAVGALIARSGHHDVVDVSVALCAAERGHVVLTSDPDDVAAVDPPLALIALEKPSMGIPRRPPHGRRLSNRHRIWLHHDTNVITRQHGISW